MRKKNQAILNRIGQKMPPEPGRHRRYSSVVWTLLVILLFSVAGFGLYSKTLQGPFIFDDVSKIKDNPNIRLTEFEANKILKAAFGKGSAKSRPVGNISFALNYYFHQYHLEGYHIVNIIIHILTGIFLFYFLKTTLSLPSVKTTGNGSAKIAFFAALIWLVNPIQTQSVTYVVQRLNSLAALFYILSFWLYVKARLTDHRGKKWSRFGGAVAAWVLALGCKQNAAILPFFIFLYEWYFLQDLSSKWLKSNLKYLAAVVILFGVIALLYLGTDPLQRLSSIKDFANKDFTLTERVMTQFRVIIYYISLIFFPHPSRLNLDYDFPLSTSLISPLTTLLSLSAIVGLILLAIYFARKERLLSFCILWFFGNLLIESSIIPLAIIFEHRNYLPSMLVCLIPVILAYRYIKLSWIKIGLMCLIVSVFSFWTYQRNRVWQNEITLWTDIVQKSPDKARPHANLGDAFKKEGKLDAAIEQFMTAVRLDPSLPEPYNNLGVVLAKQGKIDEAIDYYSRAIKIKPSYAEAYFNLGSTLAAHGQIMQAIDMLSKALQLNPDSARVHSNLGSLFIKQGNLEKALYHNKEALRLDPQLVEAHNNMGIVLMREGKLEAAISQFREALQIDPNFKPAANSLRSALAIQRELGSEVSKLRKLLQDNPESAELHLKLGNLFFRQGDRRQAIQQYKKALELDPEFLPALNNLALVTAANKEYDRALALFLDVLNSHPNDAETHFNIACMYSQLNRVDESLAYLKKAIDKGYTNWQRIKRDSDLDNIRDSLAYKELIQGH